MPIPTPAPPVKRYVIGARETHRHDQVYCDVSIEPHDEGNWAKWSEVEALLLQRAQEIEQVKALIARWRDEAVVYRDAAKGQTLDHDHAGAHTNQRRASDADRHASELDAALVSRAPQPEQEL